MGEERLEEISVAARFKKNQQSSKRQNNKLRYKGERQLSLPANGQSLKASKNRLPFELGWLAMEYHAMDAALKEDQASQSTVCCLQPMKRGDQERFRESVGGRIGSCPRWSTDATKRGQLR